LGVADPVDGDAGRRVDIPRAITGLSPPIWFSRPADARSSLSLPASNGPEPQSGFISFVKLPSVEARVRWRGQYGGTSRSRTASVSSA